MKILGIRGQLSFYCHFPIKYNQESLQISDANGKHVQHTDAGVATEVLVNYAWLESYHNAIYLENRVLSPQKKTQCQLLFISSFRSGWTQTLN